VPIGAQHGAAVDPAEPRFIGEHDPQATTAPGGSPPAFLTALGKPFF